MKHTMRIKTLSPLPAVDELVQEVNISAHTAAWLQEKRHEICNVISGTDPRLLVIIGPCSIHDPKAGLEYAERLAGLATRYQDKLLLVMRTYFEKPRTRHGWKGMLVDPHLDGSYNIGEGLWAARRFLKQVLAMGVPTATEFLDTTLAPYLADLICWGAIGARTVESQPHRQLASALPCAIGFKNSTDGNVDIAIDAIHAASTPQILCSSGLKTGPQALITEGNPFGHLILRGGRQPNYHREHVVRACEQLKGSDVLNRLVVDCSHGNSQKKAHNQPGVAYNIIDQLQDGERGIAGIMLESFLVGGNQPEHNPTAVYGQSITDECLSWADSEQLLAGIYRRL
ncbi:3-deoxy-7-phosphoheptulonate synthase [Shimwellia pseudoproteus]|uniref:3-deoxy-7-phosphoheptulonate synthase n=1 Tax=Shimwellia pseudoproteus TaxID=570012 RepID=UPI0018EB6ADA|nr:3-deoxy-7-phosphoheptulonate synthase [Shimwellia pseudoproteus]MBJ3816853.1 3-deoxy-7-phosphoheptulonate synthase [Shimwellia pseudoproteus]